MPKLFALTHATIRNILVGQVISKSELVKPFFLSNQEKISSNRHTHVKKSPNLLYGGEASEPVAFESLLVVANRKEEFGKVFHSSQVE